MVPARRWRTVLSVSCLCLVFVRIFRKIMSGVCLSRFWQPVEDCPMSFCPHFVCLDSVRNFRKNAVCCLSVRPDKDETELSGLPVSLSADVWYQHELVPSEIGRLCTRVFWGGFHDSYLMTHTVWVIPHQIEEGWNLKRSVGKIDFLSPTHPHYAHAKLSNV